MLPRSLHFISMSISRAVISSVLLLAVSFYFYAHYTSNAAVNGVTTLSIFQPEDPSSQAQSNGHPYGKIAQQPCPLVSPQLSKRCFNFTFIQLMSLVTNRKFLIEQLDGQICLRRRWPPSFKRIKWQSNRRWKRPDWKWAEGISRRNADRRTKWPSSFRCATGKIIWPFSCATCIRSSSGSNSITSSSSSNSLV